MDNDDPPPSYTSLINEQLIRRRSRDGFEHGPVRTIEDTRRGSNDATNAAGTEDSLDFVEREDTKAQTKRDDVREKALRRNSQAITSITNANEHDFVTNERQQARQRFGLWDRFKKGLENIAMFVISILD